MSDSEANRRRLVHADPWSRAAGWKEFLPPGSRRLGEDREKTRRRVGAALYVAMMAAGVWLNVSFFRREIFESWQAPEEVTSAMLAGAIPAFAMLLFYMIVPKLLDRFDPEPWWALGLAFFWGAVVATGVSGAINSFVHATLEGITGEPRAELLTRVISGPVVEEVMKGMIVGAFFFFLRREFDGIVDGIMYATFCALGFATIENVTCYARATLAGSDVFQGTFFLRGIVAPWGHPLYTCMIGIGIGIRRESSTTFGRVAAPALGLLAAIVLHAVWNYVPNLGRDAFFVSLVFWFVFVGLFLGVVITLVVRKGRIIREHLADEVRLGTLTPSDLKFVTSPFSRTRTFWRRRGALWRELISAAGRLALSKWHAERALRGTSRGGRRRFTDTAPRSISMDFISPLRDDVRRLRALIHAPRGRASGE